MNRRPDHFDMLIGVQAMCLLIIVALIFLQSCERQSRSGRQMSFDGWVQTK